MNVLPRYRRDLIRVNRFQEPRSTGRCKRGRAGRGPQNPRQGSKNTAPASRPVESEGRAKTKQFCYSLWIFFRVKPEEIEM